MAAPHPNLPPAGMELEQQAPIPDLSLATDSQTPVHMDGGFRLTEEMLQEENLGIPFQTFEGAQRIGGATVHWEVHVPEELKRDIGVVFGHGIGVKEGFYDDFAQQVAGNGIAFAKYKAVRNQGRFASMHPQHFGHPERLLYQAMWGTVRGIRERDDIDMPKEVFTAAGHSMGVRTAAENAAYHPESFDAVLGIDGAGLAKHDLGLITRIPGFLTHEIIDNVREGNLTIAQVVRLGFMIGRYTLENPGRTTSEIISIARADVRPTFGKLDALGKPSLALVSPSDQLLFAEHTLRDAGEATTVTELPDISLGHIGPYLFPDKYAAALGHGLTYLDSQKQQPLAEAA